MMRSTGLAVSFVPLAFLCFSQPAIAQDKGEICSAFDRAIDNALKIISSDTAEGMTDNSAPRATLRQLKISNQLTLVEMNMQLRRENSCPTLRDPIHTGRYLQQALECETDKLGVQLGNGVKLIEGSTLPLSCDMGRWKAGESAREEAEEDSKP